MAAKERVAKVTRAVRERVNRMVICLHSMDSLSALDRVRYLVENEPVKNEREVER